MSHVGAREIVARPPGQTGLNRRSKFTADSVQLAGVPVFTVANNLCRTFDDAPGAYSKKVWALGLSVRDVVVDSEYHSGPCDLNLL